MLLLLLVFVVASTIAIIIIIIITTIVIIVVVCTDLSGKELYRQVGMGMVVTSGGLPGVMEAHWPGMPEMWV